MDVDKGFWAYQAKYLISDVPYLLCDHEPNTIIAGDSAYSEYCRKKKMFLECIPFFANHFEIKQDAAGRMFITEYGLKKWCNQNKVFPKFLFPEHYGNKIEPLQKQEEQEKSFDYTKKEALIHKMKPLVKDVEELSRMLSNASKNKSLQACRSPDGTGWYMPGVIKYLADNTSLLTEECIKKFAEKELNKALDEALKK